MFRWLSPLFLAKSALFEWAWFDNREFWGGRADGDFEAWLNGLVREFALGGCVDLAEMVARHAGLPVLLVGSEGRDSGPVAHAAVFDARRQEAIDIFGVRGAATMVGEMREAFGANVDVRLVEATPAGEVSWRDLRLARIASALPWMPVPYPSSDRAVMSDLFEVTWPPAVQDEH